MEIDPIIFRKQVKLFKETPKSRGVRLDVHFKDGKGSVYNAEMQTRRERHKGELGKRKPLKKRKKPKSLSLRRPCFPICLRMLLPKKRAALKAEVLRIARKKA